MANKYGYKSKLYVMAEATYGTIVPVWTDAEVHNDSTIEMTPEQDTVNRLVRSGELFETTCEVFLGKKRGTVSLSGVLTAEYEWLLAAYTLDSSDSSPYTLTTQSSTYSYQMVRTYEDGASLADVAMGCVLESLEISQDDNVWNFSAVFKAKAIVYGMNVGAFTGTEPTPSCGKPFLVKNTTFTGSLGIDNPTTASFSLTHEFDDDKVTYGISDTKTLEAVLKSTGSYTIEAIHNDATSMPVLGASDVIVMVIGDGTTDWSIATSGAVETATIPDVERGTYILSYTTKMNKSASTPFTVTVS